MPRRSTASILAVWMNGEQAGTWKVTPSRGHEFSYEESWVTNLEARPISLSLPLRPHERYRGQVVENFFENLLPDNKTIRERLRQRFEVPSTSAFDLLNEIGRDCVGALQLQPQAEPAKTTNTLEEIELDEKSVANLLRNIVVPGRHHDGDDESEFRISIAGAQEKTALLWHDGGWYRPRGATPTSHILKLALGIAPSGIDLSTSIENEWLCSQLMQEFGIPVANSRIESFEDQKALVVERFDRRWSSETKWLERLPQEDFAQVTGTRPDQKYESDGGPGIKRIMDQLLGSQQAEDDRRRFMKTQVVFWLLCAIDGHAKNFSLFIERQGRFRLTPSYDVLSAHPVLGHKAGKIAPEKARMAMALWGKNRHYRWAEIRRSHFERTAKDCGLGLWAESYVDEVIHEAAGAVDAVGNRLPKNFPAEVADSICDGVKEAAKKLATS